MASFYTMQDKAYTVLKILFGVVPIASGIDKFFNILTNWQGYIAPQIADILPVSPDLFMVLVGVIEIVAGILVLTKWTRMGALVVSVWIMIIAINLVIGGYYDIAARDVGLSVSAYALYLLARGRESMSDKRESSSAFE